MANIASIKMQEAVGAVRVAEGVFEFPEERRENTCPVHHYVYRVFRADWERNRAFLPPARRTGWQEAVSDEEAGMWGLWNYEQDNS